MGIFLSFYIVKVFVLSAGWKHLYGEERLLFKPAIFLCVGQ